MRLNIQTDAVLNAENMFVLASHPDYRIYLDFFVLKRIIFNDCDFTNLNIDTVNGGFNFYAPMCFTSTFRNWKFKKDFINQYHQKGYNLIEIANNAMTCSLPQWPGASTYNNQTYLVDMTHMECIDGKIDSIKITTPLRDYRRKYAGAQLYNARFLNYFSMYLGPIFSEANKLDFSQCGYMHTTDNGCPCQHIYFEEPIKEDTEIAVSNTSFNANTNMHNYNATRVRQAQYYKVDDGSNLGLFEKTPANYYPD